MRISSYLSFFLFFLFTGCRPGSVDLRRTFFTFQSSVIEIPSLLKIEEGKMEPVSAWSDTIPMYVAYYPETQCSSCAISRLGMYSRLFQLARELNNGFQTVIVISPTEEELHETICLISDHRFPFPVYVDMDGQMKQLPIPSDERFHCFLLDRNHHPVLVGNAAISHRMEELLKKTLQEMWRSSMP